MSALACCTFAMLQSQSEYLPITFSSINLSSSVKSTSDMGLLSMSIGYTNKKNFVVGIDGSYGKFEGNSTYEDITEVYAGPRADLFLGKKGIITKFGIGYRFGTAKGSSLIQDGIQMVRKNNAHLDISFTFPISSKSGIALYPTLFGGLSDRDYSMGSTDYFTEMRTTLWKSFHEEISVSIPMIFNFSGAQVAVVPKMGRAIYNTFFELGLAFNFYHSARCTVVRRKNKKNSVLSKFYN